jgi:hypothetical protein
MLEICRQRNALTSRRLERFMSSGALSGDGIVDVARQGERQIGIATIQKAQF